MELDPEDGTHSGLNNLWIEYIDSIRSCENGIDSEPVGYPQYGSEISRIADSIQGKI